MELEDRLSFPELWILTSTLWIQGEDGEFIASNTVLLEKDKKSADIACDIFYNLNGDKLSLLQICRFASEVRITDEWTCLSKIAFCI